MKGASYRASSGRGKGERSPQKLVDILSDYSELLEHIIVWIPRPSSKHISNSVWRSMKLDLTDSGSTNVAAAAPGLQEKSSHCPSVTQIVHNRCQRVLCFPCLPLEGQGVEGVRKSLRKVAQGRQNRPVAQTRGRQCQWPRTLGAQGTLK